MVYRCGTLAAGRAVEAYQSVDCERNVAVAELARVRRIVDAQAALLTWYEDAMGRDSVDKDMVPISLVPLKAALDAARKVPE